MGADSGRAANARQLATNDGSAADGVSSLQPGIAENETARNATLACSGGVGGTAAGAVTRAGPGTVTHDPTSAQSAATLESNAMAWILLEALVALSLAVFIVW